MPILTHNGSRYAVNEIPNECPICHKAIEPVTIGIIESSSQNMLDAVFLCKGCSNLFIAKYKYNGEKLEWLLFHSWPQIHQQITQPEELKNVSPSFCEVYDQAIASESYRLNQLTGIGLRKSLEYLVKDYLIFLTPENTEKIKKTLLSQCLSDEYISNKRLLEIAKRALWLGNDEAHYDRKWEDKDIKDLKNLIHITKDWIVSEIMAINYIAEMDKPKK